MSELKKSSTMVDVGEHGLKKHDIKTSTVVFMIFCLVAAGCYGIEEMIPASGPGLTLVMLMVLPFVWGLPFGLVAAELGSVRPQEGGYYKWVQEALGEFWGFQAGWWRTVSIYIDNSLYVILVGGYIAGQWNLSHTAEMIVKIVVIAIFIWVNIRGIKDVGIVSTVLAIFVIVAFAMIAVCGFTNMDHNPFMPFTADGEITGAKGIPFADWVAYIGGGLAMGMWMYSGYESMSTIAGEVANPQVIPKATIITVPLIMATYILPTAAALGSLGLWEQWGTEPGTVGYADVAAHFWGPAFGVFFVIVAVVANCSIFNTYIASGSRGFFALADDYLAPPIMVKCDKKHGVPWVAVLSVGIVNLILINFGFAQVVIVDVFMLVASYIMVYLSAMILRKRIPKEEYVFRIPGGYGFLCLICIVPIFIAIALFFLNGTDYFIGGMIGIVSGPVLYVIWKWMYGDLAKKDPQRFPINPKTRLAVGDLRKMCGMFLGFAVMGGLAGPWLRWYEGEWGPEYYQETYGNGFLGNFDAMLSAIGIASIVFAVIGVVLGLLSIKLEPKKDRLD
ncbi:APC family permease [Clostridiales Family XIII bacterium ASD5510]|uniref:APC family permease n=1 Tax=Hominibacterium faecale TaxID=2839743 RepID=A0A9J6QKX8_9FIRM|nr:APC family permease [Hominibacterium faecale]MCU7377801.1 APC family permease [Hominibacterium faecale]